LDKVTCNFIQVDAIFDQFSAPSHGDLLAVVASKGPYESLHAWTCAGKKPKVGSIRWASCTTPKWSKNRIFLLIMIIFQPGCFFFEVKILFPTNSYALNTNLVLVCGKNFKKIFFNFFRKIDDTPPYDFSKKSFFSIFFVEIHV
jgi:hypothetical protein